MINVDTNILIRVLTGELTEKERSILAIDAWGVSAAALWELWALHRRGRVQLDMNDPDTMQVLSKVQVWPVDQTVVEASLMLDFTSDPVDEMVAATSVAHDVPLLTRDRVMLASKVVPQVG